MCADEIIPQRQLGLGMIQSCAKQWIEAVLHQGHQVLKLQEGVGAAHPPEARRGQLTQEHFFVIALGKALEWLEELASVDSQLKPAIDAFLLCVPNVREIRNMREHDREYVSGKGHQQAVFHRQVDDRVSSNATATVILNGRSLIGGRLDVEKAMAAAKLLQPQIEVVWERH